VGAAGRARGAGALQRLGGAAGVRAAVDGADPALVREGRFDVVHVHEPVVPSVSMLACFAVSGPLVATFHTAMTARARCRSSATRCSPHWRRSPAASRCRRPRAASSSSTWAGTPS
jgi:hypothetical protein